MTTRQITVVTVAGPPRKIGDDLIVDCCGCVMEVTLNQENPTLVAEQEERVVKVYMIVNNAKSGIICYLQHTVFLEQGDIQRSCTVNQREQI